MNDGNEEQQELDDELDTELDLDDDLPPAEDEDQGDEVTHDEEETPAAAAKTETDDDLGLEALESVAGIAEDDESGGDVRIPKSRFNEINDRMKAAEAKIEELGKNEPEPEPEPEPEEEFDFDAAEREWMQLTGEGEEDLALAKRKEIRAEEQKIYAKAGSDAAAETIAAGKTADDQKTAGELLATEANAVVTDYPWLGKDSADTDTDAIEMVLSMRDRLVRDKEMPPHQALRMASDKVAKMIGKVKVGDEPPAGGETKAARKDRLTRESAAAANRQPSKGKLGLGERAGDVALDINEISDEEFANLSEKKLAELGGDIVS